MDPATTCCPHLACPASGQTGQGNIDLHACKAQRFMGTACPKTFSARQGTAWYRRRTSAATVSLGVPLMAHGCPLPALVVAFGDDERTVACWLARAGVHGQAVPEPLVEPPPARGQVQADEIRVKTPGGRVWMALALLVSTRRGRAGAVSPPVTCRVCVVSSSGGVGARGIVPFGAGPRGGAPLSGRVGRRGASRSGGAPWGAPPLRPGGLAASPRA
jgi:hypothetical protein